MAVGVVEHGQLDVYKRQALSYLIKQANSILFQDLQHFLSVLKEKATEHKYTVMMGRTHGVHAEPTTFGLKLALWYAEMQRNLERFESACSQIEVGKLSLIHI